jgi:ketosteroid isomerase-like protein
VRAALTLAFVLIAGCARITPLADEDADAASLAAAETAFAAHSVREDMRAAFLAAFADDGLFVGHGWSNSNAYLAGQPAPPIVLDWRPVYVEVAASGDLGLSTGPWRLTSRESPAGAPTFGQFTSVWRREARGPWKVAADIAIGHAGPIAWDAPLTARRTPGVAGAGTLAQAEAAFATDALRDGLRAAYARHGAADLRHYRNGLAPRASREAALAAVAAAPPVAFVVERVETARSADFGYALGRFGAPGADQPDGFFLRAWRREPHGWRVVLDVANPAPRR